MMKGVSAFVSGGASGLGLATVERLAKNGAKVVLADLPSSNGEEVAKKIPNVTFAPVDVTKEKDVADAMKNLQNFRLVVCCAGIGFAKRILDLKRNEPHNLEDFKRVLEVNTVGTFNVARLACAQMTTNDDASLEMGRGVIVATASIAAYDGQMGQAAYSASKGAITSMTLPIARDLGPIGVRFVTIAPGLFETPLMDKLPHPVKNNLVQYIPFPKRLGRPDEFAHMVEHIYQNLMLNGCVIRLDAGLRMPA